MNKPDKKAVENAIRNLHRASALVGLVAQFVDSGEFDMGRWGYNVGESLLLADEVLSDCFCTLNDADIEVNS